MSTLRVDPYIAILGAVSTCRRLWGFGGWEEVISDFVRQNQAAGAGHVCAMVMVWMCELFLRLAHRAHLQALMRHDLAFVLRRQAARCFVIARLTSFNMKVRHHLERQGSNQTSFNLFKVTCKYQTRNVVLIQREIPRRLIRIPCCFWGIVQTMRRTRTTALHLNCYFRTYIF